MLGYGAGLTPDGSRERYNRLRSEWFDFLAKPDVLPKVTRRTPLCDAFLKKVTSAGPFARLQVLTDAIAVLGNSFVELPDDFGDGAHLDGGPLSRSELEELRQDISTSGQFRKQFGGRPRLDQVGHLVCEVRQALMRGQQPLGREAFFVSIDKCLKRRPQKYRLDRSGEREALTTAAETIACFALKD